MKFFIDFDDVLFNTGEFLIFLKSIFESFGVSETLFKSAYEEMRAEAGGKNFCYNFDKHIDKIKKLMEIDEKELKNALSKGLEEAPQFVFPDVKEFLEYLKEQGYTVDILSFGDQEYQSMKIKKSGVEPLVDNIIVTQEGKEQVLKNQDLTSSDTVWFFDDRVHFLEDMKKSFPFMRTVWVSRPEGRFKDIKNDFCDHQIFDLKEAKELIDSI